VVWVGCSAVLLAHEPHRATSLMQDSGCRARTLPASNSAHATHGTVRYERVCDAGSTAIHLFFECRKYTAESVAGRTFFCSSLLGARLPCLRWVLRSDGRPTESTCSIGASTTAAEAATVVRDSTCDADQTGDGPTSLVPARAAGFASLAPAAAVGGIGCCGGALMRARATGTPWLPPQEGAAGAAMLTVPPAMCGGALADLRSPIPMRPAMPGGGGCVFVDGPAGGGS
jgi:hypothetical protein